MKSKQIILPVFAICLLVLTSLTFVSAAVVITYPIAGTNHTTSVDFVVRYTNGTADVTAPLEANSSFYCNTSGTWEERTMTSWTIDATNVTFTVALTSAMDGIGGCNMTLGNTTTEAIGDTAHTPLIFDSTDPIVSIAIIQDVMTLGRIIQYTPTSSDATSGIATLFCNVTDADSAVTVLSTTTGTNFDYELPRESESGTWTFDCSASDFAGNDASATDVELEVKDQGYSVSQIEDKKSNNTMLVAIGLIIAAAYFWQKK